MKVKIYTDSATGTILYNDINHSVMITFPDIKIRRLVYTYLTSVKEFTVPGSLNIGDRRLIVKKPTDSLQLMEMALCEMFHTIGVHVDWGDPNNSGSSTRKPKDNGETFQIIN